MEEPSDDLPEIDNPIDKKIIFTIRNGIGKQWKDLGRFMGLTEPQLEDIDANFKNDESEKKYQVFHVWQQSSPSEATFKLLRSHLVDIGRQDLADKVIEQNGRGECGDIFVQSEEGTRAKVALISGRLLKKTEYVKETFGAGTNSRMQTAVTSQVFDTRKKMTTLLQKRYKVVTMKGLPCQPKEELRINKYYLDLQYRSSGEQSEVVALQDIFQIDDDGKRIHLFGGPGSGKTSTAAKLLYDWADSQGYLNESFDLVVLVSGHACADTLKATMLRALDMPSLPTLTEDDVWNVIIDPSTRLLILLDDFEGIAPNEGRPIMRLIRKECLPNATVVVLTRPGGLTPGNSENRSISESRWVLMDTTKFIDRQIEIVGVKIDIKEIKEIQNYARAFGKEQILERLLKKVLYLWTNGKPVITIFPLHLYLLTVATAKFTEETVLLTELHKAFYELLVQRYLSVMQGRPVNALSITEIENTKLEFGKFAFEILRETKLGLKFNQSLVQAGYSKFIDLGIAVNDYTHKEQNIEFIPTSKRILEFAAAFYACHTLFAQTDPSDQWTRELIAMALSLRPLHGSHESLCFLFLVGLAGEKSSRLFDVLKPYAAEYSRSFGLLGLTLMETRLTKGQKISILPFLSNEWRVPWPCNTQLALTWRYEKFHGSALHKELVSYAASQGKLKIFSLDTQYSAHLPELEVEWFILHLRSTSVEDIFQSCKAVKCRKLHCVLPTISKESASNTWAGFLKIIPLIRFQKISFEVKKVPHLWLPLILKAISEGTFKAIRWLTCDLRDNTEWVDDVTKLLKQGSVKGLQLTVCQAFQKGEARNTFENSMNMLVKTAAKSKLNRLVVINRGRVFSINWTSLFRQKSWKWVQLTDVNISYETVIKDNSAVKIKNLDITSVDMSEKVASKVSKSIQPEVTSLNCSLSFIDKFHSSVLNNTVAGLDVRTDDSMCREDLGKVLNHFPNLKVLAISITKTQQELTSLPLEKWLRNTDTCISLTGLEIWGMEANLQLAMDFVELVILSIGMNEHYTLRQKRRKMNSAAARLRLNYLMLNIGNISSKEERLLETFIQTVMLLKQSLKEKLLLRLDIVCEDTEVQSMFAETPLGNSSWVDVFPPDEGFIVNHDYYGMDRDDSFRSQETFESCPLECSRFRVTSSAV